MSDQATTVVPDEPLFFSSQDRQQFRKWMRLASSVLSLLVIATVLYQGREIDLGMIARLVPRSPLFWVVFAIAYLAGPASEWIIFHRLWMVGPTAIGALMRKLVYNELLLGYLGEAYFYTWARRTLKLHAAPFGAVKDVAVLSAMAGNIVTLAFLAAAYPFLRLLPLEDHVEAIAWSLGFVIGSSLAIMVWRGAIFSLHRAELRMVFTVHVLRILATTFFSAMLWYLVLPDTPVGWWLVLATLRLLIARMPFIPNKDVVFAGLAVLVVGAEMQLGALMAMMAALILTANLLVGMTFALSDLFQRETHATGIR